MQFYRQGDVYLIPTDDPIPAPARLVSHGRAVLALGEATGHAHVAEPDVELYETGAAADRWLRVGTLGAAVVHEEHPAIALPHGIYRVRIRREYSPGRIIRSVVD